VSVTAVRGLFNHPDFVKFGKMLEHSTEAKPVLDKLEKMKIKVAIEEIPEGIGTDALVLLQQEKGYRAAYMPQKNRFEAHRLALMTEPYVNKGVSLATRTPEDVALIVLHEGVHRVQAGRIPLVSVFAKEILPVPYRQAYHGVRNLVTGSLGGNGPVGRFARGTQWVTMDHEVEAYRTASKVANEMGWKDGFVRNGAVVSDREILADRLKLAPYRTQYLIRTGAGLGLNGTIGYFGYSQLAND
jgi:hypothetical protein